MILITGATGNIGSELIAALLPAQAGHVRVLTRNPGAVFPDGTQKVVADLGDSDLAPVLDGVHAVFLLTDGLNIAAHDHRLLAAALQAGVERIVKLSVRSVGHGATDPITTLHRAGEEAIRDSGIGWTFLRPTGFMSNALNWAPMIAADQVVHAPFAAGRAAVVDPADIAAVAAACLTHDGHNHRVYELTGPEPLSPPTRSQSSARCWAATCATPKPTRPTRSRRWCPTACPRSWRTPSSSNSAPPWNRITPSRQATSPQSRAARHAASPTGPRPTAPSSSRPPAGEARRPPDLR